MRWVEGLREHMLFTRLKITKSSVAWRAPVTDSSLFRHVRVACSRCSKPISARVGVAALAAPRAFLWCGRVTRYMARPVSTHVQSQLCGMLLELVANCGPLLVRSSRETCTVR
eukprot:13376499-Alexandrium_andersonii.AAC.4